MTTLPRNRFNCSTSDPSIAAVSQLIAGWDPRLAAHSVRKCPMPLGNVPLFLPPPTQSTPAADPLRVVFVLGERLIADRSAKKPAWVRSSSNSRNANLAASCTCVICPVDRTLAEEIPSTEKVAAMRNNPMTMAINSSARLNPRWCLMVWPSSWSPAKCCVVCCWGCHSWV